MITLTKWLYILKHYLKCDIPRNDLRTKIINECSHGKIYNAYNVDNDLIWENIIIKNKKCRERLQELKLNDVMELESYYEEQEYHKMWLEYRSIYRKNKR